MPRSWRRDGLALGLLALGFYGLTLAPGVLWGDDGHLQLQAVRGVLQGSAGSHPLWVAIAHVFTFFPLGDVAGRVNAVSAVFGALTLPPMYWTARTLRVGRAAALMASLALMVSHTFWSHAVRAEVYTLTLALMALLLWAMARWSVTHQARWLWLAAGILGLGLSAHLMVALFVPACAWLLWRERRALSLSVLVGVLGAGLMGSVPLLALIARDARALGLQGWEIVRWALFSFEGYDFSGAFFDFKWALLPFDTFEWATFLTLQFIGPALIAGLSGLVWSFRRWGTTWGVAVALLYVGALSFSFAYRVGDRYVFYLPSYLPFTLWIALGLDGWYERARAAWERRLYTVLVTLLLLYTPWLTYLNVPRLVARGITFRDTRHVPGKMGRYFFLWPSKAWYNDGKSFASAVLQSAPPQALILADPVLYSPIAFVRDVEGQRPDVALRFCCWDIEKVLDQTGTRPVVLVDLTPTIYPVEWLRSRYQLVPCRAVYCLESKESVPASSP